MLDDKRSQKSDDTFLGFDGGHGPMNSAKRIKTESAVSNTNVMNDEVFEKSYEVVYQTREQIQSNPMRKGSENMTFLQLRSQISEDAEGGIRKQVKTHPAAEQINFIQALWRWKQKFWDIQMHTLQIHSENLHFSKINESMN